MIALPPPANLVLAVLLDGVFGDPSPGHPVKLIGKLGEAGFRLFGRWGRAGGLLTLVLTALIFETIVLTSTGLLPLLEVVWLFYFLALGSLLREVRGVYSALEAEDPGLARRRLSALVSRDTERLDEKGTVRGALETLSENFNDAFCGPLFWYVVAGLPGVAFYKVAETLDSMFGYRHEPFRGFGFFPARTDDLLNFFPARLAALFIALAALLRGLSGMRALKTALTEAHKHPSTNAGWPEAALAGALGVALGGPTPYRGQIEPRPYLGTPLRELQKEDIKLAIELIKAAAFIGFLIFLGLEVWLWKLDCRSLIGAITKGPLGT